MIKPIHIKFTATVILLFILTFSSLQAQISFPTQSSYKYLKGIDAVDLSSNWANPGFDDSGWSTGNAPFRYGDGTGGTELNDMNGNYSTLYLRTKFNVENAGQLRELRFTANWDDGFVLFINGTEVIRRQAPAEIRYDALSDGLHEFDTIENIIVPATNLTLVEGENTMAVFCCNTSLAGSSDFYFDISINASIPEPTIPEVVDTIGITFDKPSGFYDASMTLTMTTPVPDAVIVYTLDGSNPQISSTRIMGSATTQVVINPASGANRGTTPAVVVRASILKDGFLASKPELRTYIYLEYVEIQSYPGWDWPSSTNINGQDIDLEMDPEVVDNEEYADHLNTSFLDIPTISLVTDNASLFNADTGIYVNAMQQGPEWERQCAVELINPDGSEGFNLNAGLRIRGGWSRHGNYPKHAFRLFFRKEYGDSLLNFPLFENEGVTSFDKIDLRCEQNYSWSNDAGQYNTFVREVFARDLQGEMGQPYTRSRYYHLYLNGMYWGLFQTQERCAASYASDYLGGKKKDWDVIKIDGVGDNHLVATDGNMEKWKEVWNISSNGYTDNAKYFQLEGKNTKGQPVKNSEVLVDIDNLIDYMINIFYTGNYDSPVSAFNGNKSPNNMYAIKNRDNKSQGFKFLIHDAEHTMMLGYSSGPGIGLQENRVNIGYIPDNQMVVNSFSLFHTQWLHHLLVDNIEYRQRFADRAYKHLNGKGVLTENANNDRLDNRAFQVNMAVIAESARWGDTKHHPAYTKADWEKEINNLITGYFPKRGDIVKNQLLEYGLYPSVLAPIIKMNGTEILDEKVFLTTATSITFSTSTGEVYYTLNGDDPRMVGGALSPKAIKFNAGTPLSIPESAIVKARVLVYGNWSALRTTHFIAEQTKYTNFKVTEIHYHPLDSIVAPGDTIEDDNFEFIEFKNTSYTSAINLSGLEFISAIEYKFPDNFLLAPQQYMVIAAKPNKFYDRYGMVATGNFAGNFTNSGEEITILNSKGTIVMDFTFDDADPWPVEPDGLGYSLVSRMANPDDDPNDASYWKKSADIHGSPFYEDRIVDEVEDLYANNISDAYMVYPNPTNNELIVSYKGNQDVDFTLELYNLNGKLLFTQTYNRTANIYLSETKISYGVYYLKIKTSDNSTTQRVVYTPF